MAASRISVTAEVVGTGSDGTEPSLLFSVQRHGLYSDDVKVMKRYLFNCGEGTQRLAGENGIKLSSLDAMYFTRFDIKVRTACMSGVPGVIFALGSCGAATLRLHGPVGLRRFLAAIRSFVRRKYPQIQCVEITGTSGVEEGTAGHDAESIEFEEWREGVERTDQHALILPIALGSGAERSGCCILCQKGAPKREYQDATKEKNKSPSASTASQIGRRRESESDEHERWRSWLLQYYTAKVPEKIPYVDVVLNRYRGRYDDLKAQLFTKYGDIAEIDSSSSPGDAEAVRDSHSNSDSSSVSDSDGNDAPQFDYTQKPLDRRWLEKFYAEHQPEKLIHIDRVLRQFSGREENLKEMLLKKYGEDAASTASAVRHPAVADESVPHKKRKLLHDGDRCDDEIPKIQANGDRLDQTHSSSSNEMFGSSSPLCYVIQFQYTPYPVVWIIDCPTPDHLLALERKLAGDCVAHSPTLVVHLSPPNVQAQTRYKRWMASISMLSTQPDHLVFNGTTLQSVQHGAFGYAFVSSAKAAVRKEFQGRSTTASGESKLNQTATPAILDLAKLLENESWSPESPYQRRIIQHVEGCRHEAHVAQSKLQFRLIHPKDLRLGFNYGHTGWHQKADQSQDEDDDDSNDGPDDHQLNLSSLTHFQGDMSSRRKLIVLGTGSAAPSKLRASSGIYMELSGTNAADVDSMLLDCGEGTFGQLWRQFGSDVTRRIGGLRSCAVRILVFPHASQGRQCPTTASGGSTAIGAIIRGKLVTSDSWQKSRPRVDPTGDVRRLQRPTPPSSAPTLVRDQLCSNQHPQCESVPLLRFLRTRAYAAGWEKARVLRRYQAMQRTRPGRNGGRAVGARGNFRRLDGGGRNEEEAQHRGPGAGHCAADAGAASGAHAFQPAVSVAPAAGIGQRQHPKLAVRVRRIRPPDAVLIAFR
ncbi:hypothetical protein ON010_g10398 [Phytophthora cinnamomi]|nr:hypothetical protein ON010_g10398 [Phytophthora cinnamomi]